MSSERDLTTKAENPNTPIEIKVNYLNAVHSYLIEQDTIWFYFADNWSKLVSSREKIQLTRGLVPPRENETLEISTSRRDWKKEIGGPGILYDIKFEGYFTGTPPLSLSDFQAYFTDIGIESKREVLGVDHQQLEVDLKGDHYSFYPTALEKGKISIHLSLPRFAGHWLDEHRFAGRVHRLEDRKAFKKTIGDFSFLVGRIIDFVYVSSGETPSFDNLRFFPHSIKVPQRREITVTMKGKRVKDYEYKMISKPIEDMWRGYEGAKCSHCGSVYKTEDVRVFEEKIQIIDPTCKHCGASTPILIEE